MIQRSADHGDAAPAWTLMHSREEFGQPDLPMLTVVSGHGVRLRDLRVGRAPSDDLSGYRVVRPGDLVVNKLWARFGAYGVSELHGIISPAYWVMAVNQARIYPRFLHQVLHSEPFLAEIGRISRNLPPNGYDLSWQAFRQVYLPVPLLAEQRRIADFLDDQVSLLDRVIKLRQEQLKVIEETTRSFLSQLLAPICRTGAGVSGLPWLAETNTPLVKLGRVCKLQSGLTIDGQRTGLTEYPYLRVANVQADRVDLSEVKTVRLDPDVAARFMLRRGDVLMNEGGDLDKLGRGTTWQGQIENCVHQNHVFALRTQVGRLAPDYLAAMTRTDHARRYFEITGNKTTNLASTNSTKVLSFPIPLPTVATQMALLAEVEAFDADRLQMQRRCEMSGALLRERKQALITAAVTGQFDVSTASVRSVA